MSLLLLWNAGIAVTPPAPTVVVVGGRPRRHPVVRKRKRVEAEVEALAIELAAQLIPRPAPWELDDETVLDLLLMDLLE